MNLKNKKWENFIIGEIFDEIINSKAYHKNQLNTSYKSKFPYITRTKQNNGLELFVNSDKNFNKNPENTIVFGAESATFFYEPFEYITGNKMYFIKDIHFNKYNCLFLVSILNNNVGKKFGYSLGLTASRLKNERIMLPVDEKSEPDYEFMSEYMKNIEKEQINKYKAHIEKLETTIGGGNVDRLGGVEWGEFFITDIGTVKSGKDITQKEMNPGINPYISSTSQNNGVKNFIGNTNKTLESDCISINRNGSVGYAFYHPYFALFSNDCRKLKINKNKYVSLFITNQIKAQKEKYNYSYKMGTNRIKRQKIMLPTTKNGEPDYDYMEQYMKNLEIHLLTKYQKYIDNKYLS